MTYGPSSAALRRIAAEEPAVLAGLVTVSDDGAWAAARVVARDVLNAAGARTDAVAVDLLLRWLASFIAVPGHEVEAQAAVVAAALTVAAPVPAGSADTSS